MGQRSHASCTRAEGSKNANIIMYQRQCSLDTTAKLVSFFLDQSLDNRKHVKRNRLFVIISHYETRRVDADKYRFGSSGI